MSYIYLVYMVALILGCLGGTVLKVGLAGAVNKKRVVSGFGLKVMLGGSFFFSSLYIAAILWN